ncbi:MAG: fatty acid desaturase [Rhodoferax sp.]|nr:fatty acid desaturase [Rhodoferax sp.]
MPESLSNVDAPIKPAESRAARQVIHTLVPRQTMNSLMQRTNRHALLHLAGHLASILVAGSLVAWAGEDWLALPWMFLLGVLLVHLFAPQHECAHYSAFRTRRLNEWVASLIGAIIVVPEVHFRYEHTDHHTHTNRTGSDPQMIPLPRSRWAYWFYLSGVPYWWNAFSGVFVRALGRLNDAERQFIPGPKKSTVIWEARLHAALYLALGVAMLSGASALFQYWLLPLLLGQPVMRFIRMAEHAGRPTQFDLLVNTRSSRVDWPWRFIAWNMNFHAEHHLAPQMPFHALPKLHQLVEDRIPVGTGYRAAHREIWQLMKRQARAL